MADDELQALVDEWGEDDVQAAFWLQQHIKEQGIDGIGYMALARSRLESTGEFTVKQTIEGVLDERY